MRRHISTSGWGQNAVKRARLESMEKIHTTIAPYSAADPGSGEGRFVPSPPFPPLSSPPLLSLPFPSPSLPSLPLPSPPLLSPKCHSPPFPLLLPSPSPFLSFPSPPPLPLPIPSPSLYPFPPSLLLEVGPLGCG